jgi:glycosyltransferase involved in cell wall biosynthesis
MSDRVVQVCLDYVPSSGGTTRSVDNFHHQLRTRVISFSSSSNFDEIVRKNENSFLEHVKVQRSWLGRKYCYASADRLQDAENAIRNAPLLICHMLWRHHIVWATRVAQSNGVPYWVIPHGSLDPYVLATRPLRKRVWMEMFGRGVLSKSSRVIFATDREREKAELTGIPMRSEVVQWPVSKVDVASHLRARASIRRSLGISLDAKVLIYLGRLHPMKRLLETVRAICRSGSRDLHLILCGPDEGISSQECVEAASPSFRDQIHPIGAVYGDGKYDYMMASDGLILLSEKENFSYVVADALACGLPVIVSPNVDLAPMAEPFRCGWFLKDMSDESIDAVLKEFVAVPSAALETMGARGQEFANSQLTEESFQRKILSLANTDIRS